MNERLVILGAGESGVGAALLGQQQRYSVWVSDAGKISERYRTELLEEGIPFEEGGHTDDQVMKADLVVKSPGIPDDKPLIQKLHGERIPVISEIEFASRFTRAHVTAITGSNGKSTTTDLTYHIYKAAGLNVAMGGNIGYSFARLVASDSHDHYVLELSSFQLDGISSFRPDISMLLNITPDHLNRYDNRIELYAASKFRIAANQRPADHFIFCSDDELTRKFMPKKITPTTHAFSWKKKARSEAWTEKMQLFIQLKQQNPFCMPINDIAISGKHNVYNSMAAGIASRILEIRQENLRDSLSDYQGLEHRLEHVAKIRDVEFINDSKATNVNSTWYALESMERPVIWLAGGEDKGNDYDCLRPLVQKKVKAIVCIGVDNTKIHNAFSKLVDLVVNTQNMNEAVRISHHLANKGDIILLSPACASFDLYKNYEDRGRQFKEAVREL